MGQSSCFFFAGHRIISVTAAYWKKKKINVQGEDWIRAGTFAHAARSERFASQHECFCRYKTFFFFFSF